MLVWDLPHSQHKAEKQVNLAKNGGKKCREKKKTKYSHHSGELYRLSSGEGNEKKTENVGTKKSGVAMTIHSLVNHFLKKTRQKKMIL